MIRPFVRTRLIWLPLLFIPICLVLWVVLQRSRRDPIYEGQRLSAWLRQIPPGFVSGANVYRTVKGYELTHPPARRALRALGTNCFPLLDDYLRQAPHFTDRPRVKWLLQTFKWKALTPAQRHSFALGALEDLGEVAAPFLEELCLATNMSPGLRRYALARLCSYAGRNMLPFLCKVAVQNFQSTGDTWALGAIQRMDPSGVAVWVARLQSRLIFEKCDAAEKLAENPRLPELALPFLLAARNNEHPEVRLAVSNALKAYNDLMAMPRSQEGIGTRGQTSLGPADRAINGVEMPQELLGPVIALPPPPCLRPSGSCPKTTHGLHCAILPVAVKEIWEGKWWMQTIEESDLRSLQIRKMIRDGWWLSSPSITSEGRINGPVTMMKPAY